MTTTKELRRMFQRLPSARMAVDRAMANATKCTAVISDMPRGGGTNTAEDRIDRLAEAREALKTLQAAIRDAQTELAGYIRAIPDEKTRDVASLYYLAAMAATDIAILRYYSYGHVYRILREADAEIEKMQLMSLGNDI